MDYTKEDIKLFQKEICTAECILKGKCIKENKNDHWYTTCPHFFYWKNKIPYSFVKYSINKGYGTTIRDITNAKSSTKRSKKK